MSRQWLWVHLRYVWEIWVGHCAEINDEFLGFGCVEQEVVVVAPSDCFGNMLVDFGYEA